MRTEIWRDIKDYEGLYQVSNFGRVKSLNYNRSGEYGVLKPVEVNGYLRVSLCKDGKHKNFFIHRLVATAFIPNPENKPQVNHKIEGKEGKSMNFVFFNDDGSIDEKRTTIEWSTSEENINYGTRTKRYSETRKNGEKSKTVFQFSKSGEFIMEWSSASEVERQLNFHETNIASCCVGKRKSAHGYIWKYKREE